MYNYSFEYKVMMYKHPKITNGFLRSTVSELTFLCVCSSKTRRSKFIIYLQDLNATCTFFSECFLKSLLIKSVIPTNLWSHWRLWVRNFSSMICQEMFINTYPRKSKKPQILCILEYYTTILYCELWIFHKYTTKPTIKNAYLLVNLKVLCIF